MLSVIVDCHHPVRATSRSRSASSPERHGKLDADRLRVHLHHPALDLANELFDLRADARKQPEVDTVCRLYRRGGLLLCSDSFPRIGGIDCLACSAALGIDPGTVDEIANGICQVVSLRGSSD